MFVARLADYRGILLFHPLVQLLLSLRSKEARLRWSSERGGRAAYGRCPTRSAPRGISLARSALTRVGRDRRPAYAFFVYDQQPQVARDAKARREMSRAAGVALIGMSAALEEGIGVGDSAGAVTMALVALAARGRRLLRSAYRLIDVGERDTAVPLLRVLNEYMIVCRWLLQASEDDLKLWAHDDLRRRLTVIRNVLSDERLDERVKQILADERERTEAAVVHFGSQLQPEEEPERCPSCNRPKKSKRRRPPSLEGMARAVGLGFVYDYSYRLQSQNDVHATALAIDDAFDHGEHGLSVRAVPRFSMEGYDSYHVGAMILLDLLSPLVERVPELAWRESAGMIGTALAAVGKADVLADQRVSADTPKVSR